MDLNDVNKLAFLALFLFVFFAIIIFAFVRAHKLNAQNSCSPIRRKFKDTPIFEKACGITIIIALPLTAISFLLFNNSTLGVISLVTFISTIVVFLLFSNRNSISITILDQGNTTVYYGIKEFESRLQEGTLDLTNCKIKYPKGYTPPKIESYYIDETNHLEDI